MKSTTFILTLLLLSFQSFCQEEKKQSFGVQVGISAPYEFTLGSYETNIYTLDGIGPCLSLNYKHDIINSRFRISPVFQFGYYYGYSDIQKNYTARNLMLQIEFDALRYKSFNIMLQLGGGIFNGNGTILGKPISYTKFGINSGIGFRYEPINSSISYNIQPKFYQRGTIIELSGIMLGLDIHF